MFTPTQFQLQVVSVIGALLILTGYIGHQFKWMNSQGVFYNATNAAGAALLAYVALYPFRIGFVILETLWVVVSVVALFRKREGLPG
jgi:hypothetical protein